MTDLDIVAREAVRRGAAQIPGELHQALEMTASLRPRVIVELGCLTGGTLYAWRHVCERVYGITLTENYKYLGGRTQRLESYGAKVHLGDTHDPASREWLLGELAGDPVDVLIVDADHRYEAVKEDLRMYGSLVRPGGMIFIHDVLLRPPEFGDSEFQVWRLWEQLQECCDTAVLGTEVGWGVIRVRPETDFLIALAGMQFAQDDMVMP